MKRVLLNLAILAFITGATAWIITFVQEASR